MPHITFPIDPAGLLLNVMVGLDGGRTASLVAAGQAVPRPLLLRGEIDNGSNITCVAARVLQQFGLPRRYSTTTTTPAGTFHANVFEVSFSITPQGTLTVPLLVLEHLEVVEWLHPQRGARSWSAVMCSGTY